MAQVSKTTYMYFILIIKLIEKEETDPNMVGRNWFTIAKAAIISLIVVNSTLRGEEGKKRENKGCTCRS